AAAVPNDDQTIHHALSRIGFGARPGDVEAVRVVGLQKYVDQQLHPERISDPNVTAHLVGMPSLRMSSRDIAEQYAMPLIEARREKKQEQTANNGVEQPKAPDPVQQKANRVLVELGKQKMLRAVYS